MFTIKPSLALGGVALFALTACTEPAYLNNPDDPNRQTKNGAIIGGLVGATAGIIAGDDGGERRRGAAIGAIVGATGGGLIGARLDQQEADLRASIGNNNVGIVNTGSELIVTMPQDILFAVDSAALRPDLARDLGALAQNLQAYPDSTVDILGHTDNTGDAGYNQGLSQRRAQAVADVLVNNGISSIRLRAIGRGEDAPIASNLTPEGRAQNRRVEIVIRPNA
ncbi:OmpA family protein [Algirhabdus cladophorae]|uniref:OmpA family protein n=1 Tax=Algirhabdus cladophorae TaxID=3377108 RepID=UPI003B846541